MVVQAGDPAWPPLLRPQGRRRRADRVRAGQADAVRAELRAAQGGLPRLRLRGEQPRHPRPHSPAPLGRTATSAVSGGPEGGGTPRSLAPRQRRVVARVGARQARALLEAMCASTSNPLRESGRRLGGANVAVLRVRAKRPCAPRHESWPTRSGVWAFSVLHPVAVALEKQAWRRLERGLCPAGARRPMRWLDISGPRLLLHRPKVRPQHLGSVRWPLPS